MVVSCDGGTKRIRPIGDNGGNDTDIIDSDTDPVNDETGDIPDDNEFDDFNSPDNDFDVNDEDVIQSVCGNGIIETGEICDSNTVQCTTLSSDYISGTATCNSTCSGYNQGGCEEDDGW